LTINHAAVENILPKERHHAAWSLSIFHYSLLIIHYSLLIIHYRSEEQRNLEGCDTAVHLYSDGSADCHGHISLHGACGVLRAQTRSQRT